MMSLKWQFYCVGGLAVINSFFKFFWIFEIVELNENNVALTSVHSKILSLINK